MKKHLIILVLALGLILSSCSNEAGTTQTSQDQNGETSGSQLSVGIIQFSEHLALDRAREGFVEELEALGYDLDVDFVNIQQDMSLIPTTAAKFESDGVDLIYAIATPVAQGIKSSIQDIPIIFNAVTDPESAELTGDNITGVSDFFPVEDQLDLFLEDFPDVKTLGALYSLGEANSEAQIKNLRAACEDRGIGLEEVAVNTTNDVNQAMASLIPKIDAFVLIQDNLAASSAPIISNMLIEAGLPSFAGEPGPAEEGILLSDGVDYLELGKEAGKIADRVAQGESASEIEVFFPTEASRLVNKNTADALGIDPSSPIFEGATIHE